MTPSANSFTSDQIEQMRHLLSLHDAQTAGKGQKEIDLNNPPTVQYRHQEYPLAMYNHQTSSFIRCNDAAQEAELEAKGWSREALPVEEPQVQLSAADQLAVDQIDPFLKRGPGRPKRVE